MGGRERARGLDGAEHLARVGPDDGERVGARRSQPHAGGRVVLAPPGREGPRRSTSRRSARTARRSRASGHRRTQRPRRPTAPRGRRPADAACRSARTRGRGSPPRPAARGTRPDGGKELIEAVLAGDIDSEPSAATPARPHCWRRLATVPGNVTEIAASSWPMSIPSSSALVVDDAVELPGDEPALDLASLLGRVAGAVGRDRTARRLGAASQRSRARSAPPLRDREKQIVRTPELTRSASNAADSRKRRHDGRSPCPAAADCR